MDVKHRDSKNKIKSIDKIFSAFTLIILGIIFLLNSTGAVPWTMWGTVLLIFLTIWPLYLVIAGLGLILGKNPIAKLITSFLSFLILAGTLTTAALVTSNSEFKAWLKEKNFFTKWVLSEEDKRESTQIIKSDEFKDVKERLIKANLTSGGYSFGDEGEDYLKLDAKYYKDHGEPELSQDYDDSKLLIEFKQKFDNNFFTLFSGDMKYNFTLGRGDYTTNLDLNITAGDGRIDFDEVALDNIDINLTAGDLDLTLGEKSLPQMINIDQTAGSINIELPESTGIEIEYDKTAGDIEIEGEEELEDKEGTFTYNADASEKVKIKVDMTAGSLDINFK